MARIYDYKHNFRGLISPVIIIVVNMSESHHGKVRVCMDSNDHNSDVCHSSKLYHRYMALHCRLEL